MGARPAAVTCVIAEDDATYVKLLREQFARAGGITVVATAKTGDEALAACEAHTPDVLILDHRMPQGTGLNLVPRLREALPRMKIILHSAFADSEVGRMDQAGRVVIVGKDKPFEALIEAVRSKKAPSRPK